MTAKHTDPLATFYQCDNQECSHRTGIWVQRERALELLEQQRRFGAETPDVRAREDMKDVEGD